MSQIEVTVPARPDFIHVVRSVTGAVAAGYDLPYDAVDDLRIAVDEACSHLLDLGGGSGSLSLMIVAVDGRIRFLASIDSPLSDWPPADANKTLTWQVLAALAEDAEFARTERGPGIRFSKRLPT